MKFYFFLHNYVIGENMSGPGLRTFELAQVLANYFNVSIICKDFHIASEANIRFYKYNNDWKNIILSADVVCFNDMPDLEAMLFCHKSDKFIISENAVPLEHLEYDTVSLSNMRDQIYKKIIENFVLQVQISDYFIVRSDIRYSTMISVLATQGRISCANYMNDKKLLSLITLVPIGYNRYSEIKVKRIQSCEMNIDLIWNGGLWNYMDIEFLLSALDYCRTQGSNPNLLFMYRGDLSHPMNNLLLIEEYIRNHADTNVRFSDSDIPHTDRGKYIKSSKALLCLGKNGIENKTCVRLRVRDSFLYEKPLIIDSYGATADFVRKYEIGYVVTNFESFYEAIEDIRICGIRYRKICDNIKKYRESFLIENNIDQLIDTINNYRKIKGSRKAQCCDSTDTINLENILF